MWTDQASAGSGYVALIFFDDARGKEVGRLQLPFEPVVQPIKTVKTNDQGQFLVPMHQTSPTRAGFVGEFAGDQRHRGASAQVQ